LPFVERTSDKAGWGQTPWVIDFHPSPQAVPKEVDFAVVGGGFTGLSAAAWLRRMEPGKSVALLEAATIGAGASGRTGGMALAETASGDLPGLGDVLAGFSEIIRELDVDCDLALPGAWEIGRKNPLRDSPISWSDSGDLRVVNEVPGGTINPGKLVSGLAQAAERAGVRICENTPVENMAWSEPLRFMAGGQELRAGQALLATNALSLEMSGLADRAHPMFTMAVATAPLAVEQIAAMGLASGKPFYTIDFPYLWGRLLPGDAVLFGGGLVRPKDWRELGGLDVGTGEPAELIAKVEKRIRKLHPVLDAVEFTHRWGGPILATDNWRPVFARHRESARGLVSGAYAGHGVALSVYLGRWAAEAMLGRRPMPAWDTA
jgi:glycine/D-amino acid oxidase-like deaminating enzyme